MFEAGVGRVVIGSLAVQQPELMREFIAEFGGERITLALDVNMVDGVPMVATAGWAETSGLQPLAGRRLYPDARHLLVTDIGRDGMMSGPNFELLTEAVERAAASCRPGLGRDLLARRSARAADRRRDHRQGALGGSVSSSRRRSTLPAR